MALLQFYIAIAVVSSERESNVWQKINVRFICL